MSLLQSQFAPSVSKPAECGRLVLGGVEVDPMTADQALQAVRQRLAQGPGRPLFLGSANLDHIQHFGPSSGRRHLHDRRDARWLVLLDGMPLVWMASRLTAQPQEQLAGSDLLPRVLAEGAGLGARLGLLGGSTEMHQALAERLHVAYPELRIAGRWSPARNELADPDKSAALADCIRATQVDLLVVALGKPRQECWLAEHGARAGVKVGLAFGAAGDFMAGTAKRAPQLWSRRGLEWLYRLLREPRRLGVRYLVQGPANVLRLLCQSHYEPTLTPFEYEPLALNTASAGAREPAA